MLPWQPNNWSPSNKRNINLIAEHPRIISAYFTEKHSDNAKGDASFFFLGFELNDPNYTFPGQA